MSSTQSGAAVVEEDAYGPIYPLTREIQARVRTRTCLRCGDDFLSKGPGFRICSWCQNYLRMNEVEDPFENRARGGARGRVDGVSLFELESSGLRETDLVEDVDSELPFEWEEHAFAPPGLWRVVEA